jgi:AraC family transcriptional regulator, regulatory protein of adaptative response / methylated-DNA-[protein]-cysteine methyltransferase
MEAQTGALRVAKPAELEAERFWRAVVERDRRFDGRFVYAVETTTVYCRPSCPSRRPLRKNVRFLASAEAAERKGYRACQRCKPQERLAPAEAVVERVRALLASDAERSPTLAELARAVSLSPSHLQRLFKRHTGLSPKAYVDARRFQRLKHSLRTVQGVSDAMYAAGYQAPSRAYEKARGRLGMTPSAYRAGGAGQHIAYAVADSSLGRTLVARTPRGVCRVAFGTSEAVLVSELRAEFPAAELVRAEGEAERWVQEVVQAVDASGKAPSLALDAHGTAFQLRVWKALQEIPAGRTASYGDVARAIQAPGSARAVAQACASNPVAVLVPCHRVVRSDGALGGYRWGVARKRRLLERERGQL